MSGCPNHGVGDNLAQDQETSSEAGCRNAQTGAIERMFRHLAHLPGARCLLSGGAAPRLEELLGIPFSRVDNLVLKGLAVIAREDAAA